ncbi:MAG TPA: hypothetical protein VKY19_20430 [Ktedonosporobacter sp.]|jgi:hypothetical protein|nr:hypothetical protein [Ktedonosporobacter sp.]
MMTLQQMTNNRSLTASSIILAQNPVLIQSHYGNKGNFELVVPLASGGMAHFFRDNDAPGFPWYYTTNFGTGYVDAISMIESNFGIPGNLEVIARVGSQLFAYYRDTSWHGPFPVPTNGLVISGNPVLIQSRFGSKGNFEMIVPLASGGMAHFFRDNDAPGFPWHYTTTFGTGYVDAVSMIESNFGMPGNLEVVARIGSQLFAYYRDTSWHGPFPIPTNGVVISGNPALIQSHFGNKGNFELVSPLASGGMVHFFRDNDAPGFPWHCTTTFGTGYIDAISMIESNFGMPGNLEVAARVGSQLFAYYRDSAWHGPSPIVVNISQQSEKLMTNMFV